MNFTSKQVESFGNSAKQILSGLVDIVSGLYSNEKLEKTGKRRKRKNGTNTTSTANTTNTTNTIIESNTNAME